MMSECLKIPDLNRGLDLPPFHFSVEEVERALLELEIKKGDGIDGITRNHICFAPLSDFQQLDINLCFS
jgi:hypothetical protein